MAALNRTLESAIPLHLRVQRTRRSLCPHTFDPPYPTFVGRFREDIERFVIMYLGIQSGQGDGPEAVAARSQIQRLLRLADGPRHFDQASFVDEAGYDNLLFACYWDDAPAFGRWSRDGDAALWWSSEDRLADGVGYYRETFMPRATRLETHFAADKPEGIAVLATGMSGEIQEHAYWGAARDRLPIGQTDPLEPGAFGGDCDDTDPRRGRIRPVARDNLCLIRSGQDWSDTDAEEKALYDRDILPHLENGMTFLRDEGCVVGCLENRFVQCVDLDGTGIGKSYGMGIWHSLADLEKWAATHPTHLAIFNAGGAYMEQVGSQAGLKTYHEICVLPAEAQDFEYVGCHPRTGLLKAARAC